MDILVSVLAVAAVLYALYALYMYKGWGGLGGLRQGALPVSLQTYSPGRGR